MAKVILKNVYKYYDKNPKPAVSDFNLEIKDKEFVVFVGPSGCGKSTTLRMIAGIEEISDGVVYIGNKIVNEVEPKDRDIAMVFQNYALYPHMTVYDNMAFGIRIKKIAVPKLDAEGNQVKEIDKKKIKELEAQKKKLEKLLKSKNEENTEEEKAKTQEKIASLDEKIQYYSTTPVEAFTYRKYTKEEIDTKIKEAAKVLEITEYLKRKPKALSGGQRQRVAIGRAIVRNPKVFLMDEPLSNLDAKLRNQMRSEIILLHEKLNTTFIYVTHDQIEAMTLGDRIVVMKDGFIQQVGTPSEVFNHPSNLFVAGFIGSPQMNFFGGKLNSDYTVDVLGKHISLNESVVKQFTEEKVTEREVIVGIRPEHINLSSKKDALTGKVIVAEMMGSEYYLHIKAEDNNLVVKVPIIGLSKENLDAILHNGDISFEFNLDTLHIFDRETQLNMIK